MTDAPTLHDLYLNSRVKGLSFWCNEFTCRTYEVFPVGVMAIDYGPVSTLADLKADCWCRECGAGRMTIVPNWGEGGPNFFERLGPQSC